MTTTSPLVHRAIVATAAAMDTDVDLFGVPVDLPGRAVVFLTAPIRLVVKIDADIERARREATASTALAGVVPVPEVWFSHLYADDGHEHWVSGISFCDGDRLANTPDETPWTHAGSVLKRLHSFKTASWPNHWSHPNELSNWVPKLAGAAEESGLLGSKVAKAFSDAAAFSESADRAPTAIHGDLTADYIFHDGQRVSAVINLGDSGMGDPVYDLATLTLWHPELLESVLAGYGEVTTSGAFGEDLERFQLLRLLGGAQWLHNQGFSAAPYLSELYERLLH